MKTPAAKGVAFCGALLLAIVPFGAAGYAQSEGTGGQSRAVAAAPTSKSGSEARPEGAQPGEDAPAIRLGNEYQSPNVFTETRLGVSLLKNIALNEKAIATSPAHLRLDDTNWLLPFAGIAAISLATDTHVSAGLARYPTLTGKSATFSNYGLAGFGGMAGGLYLLGKITDDDREQETGVLSAEAAADALGLTTALQYSFGRERPTGAESGGEFWRNGTSFPSGHAAAAWAVAGIVAHEYPGLFTKIVVYGLATAVSFSRVAGEDHFPTDVLVGGALGWFAAQRVYRAHHDPDLGGASWETFREARAEGDARNFRNAGTPYVPLDSWVYPVIDRLIALGYIHSAFQDVRPLTRFECAALAQEAAESIADAGLPRGEADRLQTALENEFQSESSVLSGAGKEQSVRVESIYSNVTVISGKPLNDSYHFGQTLIDDFGRAYQEGFNTYDGFSGYGTTGPFAVYVRGEFQSAPSAPAYPLAARIAIATADDNPVQPATPVSAASQFRLLDTYIAANIEGWDFSVGKQSLWWGRGVGGALTLSDNAEPMYMFRMRPMQAIELPWILHWLGPMKGDFFFGKLSGNEYPPRPLIHGLKLTAKTTRYLEASLLATSEFGGVGRPLTFDAVLRSFFSTKSSDAYPPSSSPGKRTIGADFSYAFPHLRDVLQFYANGLLPEDNPTNLDNSKSPIYIWQRLAIRTGIYIPRLPRLPKLDFRVESAYTDPPTARSVGGHYIYSNDFYHDLYTNKGNLIGDWVGREGTGFQGWSTYWLSPKNSVQFAYRHAKVNPDFIPGGETINDGSIKVSWQLRPEWNASASLQYEKWLAPILATSAETNWTSSVQIQFSPHSWGR